MKLDAYVLIISLALLALGEIKLNLDVHILIIGLALLALGEIKQILKFLYYWNKFNRSDVGIGYNEEVTKKHNGIDEIISEITCYHNPISRVAAIITVIIFSIILTWVAFKAFPTTIEAQKVVTVLAGIFGVFSGSIGLFKLLK
jgi:hypothetical protein